MFYLKLLIIIFLCLFEINMPVIAISNASSSSLHVKIPKVVISIDLSVFFDKGSTELKESANKYLEIISKIVKDLDKNCIIEGHTTQTEYLYSDYSSNWELSLIQVQKIVQYLIDVYCLTPNKIRFYGLGETVPQKSLNNRIDFIILDY